MQAGDVLLLRSDNPGHAYDWRVRVVCIAEGYLEVEILECTRKEGGAPVSVGTDRVPCK